MTDTMEFFVVERGDATGENWTLAFGTDDDGSDYAIATNHMHGSEAMAFLHSPKPDAELVCRLLNEHYTAKYAADSTAKPRMTSDRLEAIRGFLLDAAAFGDGYAVAGEELIAEIERLQAELADAKAGERELPGTLGA